MPAQGILGQALTEQSLTIKDMGFCLQKEVQHSAVLLATKLPGKLADLCSGACTGILLTWQGTINLYNNYCSTISNYVGIAHVLSHPWMQANLASSETERAMQKAW